MAKMPDPAPLVKAAPPAPGEAATSPCFIHSELDDAGLSVAEFRVFCHIRRRGECIEAVPKWAPICRVHEDTIWAALNELIRRGMVSRTSRPGQTSIFRVQPFERWKPTHRKPRGDYPPETKGCHPPETKGCHPPETKGCHPPETKGHKGNPSEGNPSKGEKGPPKFERVKRNLFPREYGGMIKDCRAEIEKIKGNPKNWIKDLAPKVEELIDGWKADKPDGWEQKIAAVIADLTNYVRSMLKPGPAAVVNAWQTRIEEIKKAKKGQL